MKPKIIDIIDGTRYEFDSPEEMWFAWWLEELKRYGVIVSWQYQAKTWVLSNPCNLLWEVQGARKMLQKSKCLLRAHSYTADFTVQWKNADFINVENEYFNESDGNDLRIKPPYKPDAIMLVCNDDLVSYVDVKGGFVRGHSKSEAFEVKRGIMWEQHGEYINRIVPYTSEKKKTYDAETQEPMVGGGKPCLFRDTFYPQRFMLTDKGHQPRKIHGPVRRIEEWLSPFSGGIDGPH